MAKSLNKIVESLLIDLKQVTDESYLHNRRGYLIDKVIGINNSLIRELFLNGSAIDRSFYTKTDCVEVELENKTCTINGIVFTSKVDLYKATVPRLISGIGGKELLYVGDDTLMNGYGIKSLSGFQSLDGNVYTGKNAACTLLGNELLLKNIPTGVKRLTLIGLFGDPTELGDYDYDAGFNTPSTYKLEMLIKKDLVATWGLPLDTFKSENDETVEGKAVQQPQPQQ